MSYCIFELAGATCGIRENHTETKKFGSQIWFWQKIAKSRFGCQIFFWFSDSFLACDICLHDWYQFNHVLRLMTDTRSPAPSISFFWSIANSKGPTSHNLNWPLALIPSTSPNCDTHFLLKMLDFF